MLGVNVFAVLLIGVVLYLAAGFLFGSLDYVGALSAMGSGTAGMFETMIVTVLVASISALMKEGGGFAAILEFIKKRETGKKGGMADIGLLTVFLDIATANNTVAIVIAAPIAKEISEEYGVSGRVTASLLDTFSCIAQGIIPYGAQLLIASSLAGISSIEIIPWLLYPFILMIFVVVSIIRAKQYGTVLIEISDRRYGKETYEKPETGNDTNTTMSGIVGATNQGMKIKTLGAWKCSCNQENT